MGQRLSCGQFRENDLFVAVQTGELETVEAMADDKPNLLTVKTVHAREKKTLAVILILCVDHHWRLDNWTAWIVDLIIGVRELAKEFAEFIKTPLMLAAMHGKISCVGRLIQAGANVLLFDTLHERTCLHYAAYYGHSDCLQLILSAAYSTPVAQSWGFSRFVNIRDGSGATPLHLAAHQRRRDCVHVLLSSGALVLASTGGYSYPGSTPLHLVARGGSFECVRELLAWGADCLQRDSSGRIPYMVAVKHKHEACAALLNPIAPEPLTWPLSFKFITELNPEAKVLLEKALIEANKKREKVALMEASESIPQSSSSDVIVDDFEANDAKLCCICFEHDCTIEVQECGHEMCAHCTLALCCHIKPNSAANSVKIPQCPFCRTGITRLVVAKNKIDGDLEMEFSSNMPRRTRKSFNLGEGSSSFKSLSSLGSFGRLSRGLGKVGVECNEELDKT